MDDFHMYLIFIITGAIIPLVQYLDTMTKAVGEIIRTEVYVAIFAGLAAWGLSVLMEIPMSNKQIIMESFAATGFGKLGLGGLKALNSKRKKKG